MNIQSIIKIPKPFWHKNEALESFTPIEAIEGSYGRPLPADLKYFYQWFSDGGEGRLPGGYLSMYRVSEILDIQEEYGVRKALGDLLVFANDGDEAFALDFDKNRDTACYPVVQFSFGAMDRDAVEQAGENFGDFLQKRLRPRVLPTCCGPK